MALIFLLQCLFPIFELTSGEWIGLSTVNADAVAREYAVTATSPDGLTTQTGRFSLAAGAQRSYLLLEVLGVPNPLRSGWIRVDSPAQKCTTYLATGTDQVLVGTDAVETTGATLLIPHVAVNTGFMELAHTDTRIAIINANDRLANILAHLFHLDGSSAATLPLNVVGGGSSTFRVSELFATFLPGNNVGGKTFQGHIRITSNVPIAAWQRIETPLTQSMLRGKTSAELPSTVQAMFPHFVFDATYRSTMNVVNPATSPLSLELAAFSNTGQQIGETRIITLAPGEALRGQVGSIFRVVVPAIFPPPRIEGYIRIRQAQGTAFQLLGTMEISTDTASVLSTLNYGSGTTWTMPLAVGSAPWLTSYVIANPNELLTVQTDVHVEEVSSSGTVVRRNTISLSPRNRFTGSVLSPISSGYLRFSANLPIVVLGGIATDDGKTMDGVSLFR
jgi:hypothetical protein